MCTTRRTSDILGVRRLNRERLRAALSRSFYKRVELMPDHPVPMTQEGLAKIEQELDHLKHVRRPQVAERIRQAKELASTQNNAEYDDAKNEQAFVEGRILTLEKLVQDATIIDEKQAHHASQAQIGPPAQRVGGKGK